MASKEIDIANLNRPARELLAKGVVAGVMMVGVALSPIFDMGTAGIAKIHRQETKAAVLSKGKILEDPSNKNGHKPFPKV